jgi:hypothetical protein
MSLLDDCNRAMSNVRQAHIDHVLALGVSPEAIAGLGTRQMPFGVERIGTDDAGRWWPDPEGKPAVVVPVIEWGELIDIVAFRSSQPARWWWRVGCGSILGADVMERSVWPGDKLLVVGTPLAWIAAEGQACCILDWGLPDCEVAPLRDQNELVCDTAILAARLRRRLSQPRRVPPITVEMGNANVAAA